VRAYQGRGRPATCKQPQPEWQYVQVVKERSGNRVTGVHIKVVYGEPSDMLELMGGHTAYVERTNLTSRQMNGRLVRKTLSYSKQLAALNAACAWEDWVYNLTRSVDTLSLEVQMSLIGLYWLSVTPDDAGFTLHTALVVATNRTSHGHSRRA
jgi:hypothetical protein